MDQSLKKILHKIWDEHQSFDVKFIQRYLGVQKKIDLDELRKEYRNWLGGDRVAFDKAHKLLSQKQRAIVGGYDFEFKPHNWVINTTDPNVTVYVDSCYVDPYGQVTLFGNNGGTYDIGEVISGEEFSTGEMGDVSSDVKYEIKEIVNDQLKDLLLKNCGIQLIPFPDIIYNSKPFDKPLREHILTELAEKYYDEDITKSFELIINKLLKNKYEWFDRIIINKLSGPKDPNYLGIVAELFADEDWVGKQWMEHHYSTPIPSGTEDDPISLGDIISGKLSKELQDHFKNVFKIITSEKKPKYLSWSWIDVIPVEMEEKNLTENILRIKEMMGIIDESKEEQKVLQIPSLKFFNDDWFQLQEFLENKGNPPYSISGDLKLSEEPIKSLGNLQSVGGYLNLLRTPIESLGNLQSVGEFLHLVDTPIESLGNLKSVGGDLGFDRTPIKSLGNLESVGGVLYLIGAPIKSLGNLKSVGGDLFLKNTPLSKKYSEKKIRQMVNVNGEIYL